MSDSQAYQVPLHERLASVPERARLVIESADGMETSYIPVGALCQEAARELRERLARQEQPEWADECRVELVTAIHSIASDYENALYAFGKDAEARRKAEGDITHARKLAARWNWNGTRQQPARQVQEPVAWKYELATKRTHVGYVGWEERITDFKPNITPGAIRKVTPLYANAPQPAQQDLDIAELEHENRLMRARNERLQAELDRLTKPADPNVCPPCNQNCRQGRDCPARAGGTHR